jgi:hypothetical protein
MDGDGDFVVTWTSYSQDGGVNDIYARRYNNSGVAIVLSSASMPTRRRSGQPFCGHGWCRYFVITWHSNGQDGSEYGVYAQRYNSSGTAVGSEFRVNTTTAGRQFFPAVAMNNANNFVISWMSGDDDFDVYADRFNYNKAPVARNDVYSVAEDVPSFLPILGTDTDDDGDTLLITGSTAPYMARQRDYGTAP